MSSGCFQEQKCSSIYFIFCLSLLSTCRELFTLFWEIRCFKFYSSANVFTDAMMEKRQFFNNMLPEMSVMRVKIFKKLRLRTLIFSQSSRRGENQLFPDDFETTCERTDDPWARIANLLYEIKKWQKNKGCLLIWYAPRDRGCFPEALSFQLQKNA